MSLNELPLDSNFGLLPEYERRPVSFITSAAFNLVAASFAIYLGMTAKRVIEQHHFEQTEIVFPTAPPRLMPKKPAIPQLKPQPQVKLKLNPQKIQLLTHDPKPLQIELKEQTPVLATSRIAVTLAPQPKAVLAPVAPAHLGDINGVTPNSNALHPPTAPALVNPYGGNTGTAVAPSGRVGETGLGSIDSSVGRSGVGGRVTSAGIPGFVPGNAGYSPIGVTPESTNLEILSKPSVQYTAEARQRKVQGDVVLRVTFTSTGQVIVQGVIRGLGYGLDEEAEKVARQIRFRPATRNGRAADLTTNITITFELV